METLVSPHVAPIGGSMTDARVDGVHQHAEPDRLVTAASDDAGFYAAVAEALVRPADRLVADVGCGGGGMAMAMARRLAPGGRVVAVDSHGEILDAARAHVREGLGEPEYGPRVDFVTGALEDGRGLRAAIGGAPDLIWASAVIHHVGDQQGAVDTLAALLAIGGRLAIQESGLRRRHLPWDVGVGAPGLEARLEAAAGHWYTAMRAGIATHKPLPYGWTTAMRRAGLVMVTERTFLIELPAPLSTIARRHALTWLDGRVTHAASTNALSADDLAAWQRLLSPDDSEWLGHRDDLHLLEARTVQTGVRTRTWRGPLPGGPSHF
jgi:SAM-dependent methyltransferase